MDAVRNFVVSMMLFGAYLVPPAHPSRWWIPINAAMITGGIYFAVLAAIPELSNVPKSNEIPIFKAKL